MNNYVLLLQPKDTRNTRIIYQILIDTIQTIELKAQYLHTSTDTQTYLIIPKKKKLMEL